MCYLMTGPFIVRSSLYILFYTDNLVNSCIFSLYFSSIFEDTSIMRFS